MLRAVPHPISTVAEESRRALGEVLGRHAAFEDLSIFGARRAALKRLGQFPRRENAKRVVPAQLAPDADHDDGFLEPFGEGSGDIAVSLPVNHGPPRLSRLAAECEQRRRRTMPLPRARLRRMLQMR